MAGLLSKVLIVGGGFSGLSAAIMLRRQGVQVDLVEITPGWTTYGAGISIGGPSLRAFRTLGILPRFLEEGHASDGTEIRTSSGQMIAEIPTPRVAGADVPGNGAVMRPVLAKILGDAALEAGTSVRLGCTFTEIAPTADHVDVAFTDGETRRYDLVIGADGLRSKLREAVFPGGPQPRYSGQGVWRAVLPRLAGIDKTILWVGPETKVGVNPVSRTEMYLFVNENRPVNERIPEEHFVPLLKGLLEPFPAPEVQAFRAQLSEASQILFRPLEGMLMPLPWHAGRVVLIGDAVHATTPHLAAGAGIGVEDAIVLAEELARGADLAAALKAFEQRRWERCRMVVHNSGRLGEIEVQGGSKAEHAALMVESFRALTEDI
ncbi:FAD-dependent oxidoreductase [Acidocella sp. KAb 2-4]|uniref:FAD-dependent oxidoreductase n=1 Tax=Acidocella sp. KAb 2-4 TaxID=2885158 RepID=UPI001D0697B7|nr:FAD-dependent oxidoreductase [Acidocella sp. KAb 2-4]MCB5945509.1 FAD-dependent oxidoreductase [Acidocella sp. KAb 2-4]